MTKEVLFISWCSWLDKRSSFHCMWLNISGHMVGRFYVGCPLPNFQFQNDPPVCPVRLLFISSDQELHINAGWSAFHISGLTCLLNKLFKSKYSARQKLSKFQWSWCFRYNVYGANATLMKIIVIFNHYLIFCCRFDTMLFFSISEVIKCCTFFGDHVKQLQRPSVDIPCTTNYRTYTALIWYQIYSFKYCRDIRDGAESVCMCHLVLCNLL